MKKLMKPERLSVDPNSSTAAKEWKHWHKTFDNFLSSFPEQDEQVDKLKILVNYLGFEVYEYVEECQSYTEAVETLQKLFVKTPNEVFARHLLASAKQKPDQTLDEFLQQLRKLSKDCNCRAVTAEEYRQELIRDAFINGLMSSAIRQRLLENRQLTLESAFTQACSIELAQRNSRSYELPLVAAATVDHSKSPERKNATQVSKGEEIVALSAVKRCQFCGRSGNHPRTECPARNATCYRCGKRGHFSNVCKSKQTSETVAAFTKSTTVCAIHPAPSCLSFATVNSLVNGQELSTLIDSGSSSSYINEDTARKLDLEIIPSNHRVTLALSTQECQGSVIVL